MMEYIFFDRSLSDLFVEYAGQQGVECTQTQDDMGITVALPEDLPEAVEEVLENRYDELLEQQAALIEAEEPGLIHVAGIRVELADGRPCMVRIAPEMMNRLLGCMSIEELHGLVTGIARDVENPDGRALCCSASSAATGHSASDSVGE